MQGIVFFAAGDRQGAGGDCRSAGGLHFAHVLFGECCWSSWGSKPQDFVDAVAARECDEEVWAWVKARMRPRSATEIMAFNREMMIRTPDDDAARERYWQFMADIGQSHRTDVSRQFDRLDFDEGRDVPLGGPPVTPTPPSRGRSPSLSGPL